MDASLDTNVIMHLYKANLQDMLFNRFEKLKVYEFIRNQELKKHAEPEVIDLFDEDVESGQIELITDTYLKEIGMYNVFQAHVRDLRILYGGGDLGEVYAISMAKTLGCISLVTDDLKEYGPHYTLMRIEDSEVMPFAFYELLFLDFMEQRLTEAEVLEHFNKVCDLSDMTWNCASKLKAFMRRFWISPYSECEREWMEDFCEDNGVDAMKKLRQLSSFLTK